MGRELSTQTEVVAPAGLGWSVLTDFAAYPSWNPFIIEVNGTPEQNALLKYRFEFPRGIRIWADAKVLRAEPDRELRWAAHFLSAGVFNGEHYFVIDPTSESRFVFHHGEIFSGALLGVALPVLQRLGPNIYRSLNAAFKARVESLV
jgi:hypothetical protein